jgi:hypothetical protein
MGMPLPMSVFFVMKENPLGGYALVRGLMHQNLPTLFQGNGRIGTHTLETFDIFNDRLRRNFTVTRYKCFKLKHCSVSLSYFHIFCLKLSNRCKYMPLTRDEIK